jgi:hypothetical protein
MISWSKKDPPTHFCGDTSLSRDVPGWNPVREIVSKHRYWAMNWIGLEVFAVQNLNFVVVVPLHEQIELGMTL